MQECSDFGFSKVSTVLHRVNVLPVYFFKLAKAGCYVDHDSLAVLAWAGQLTQC